MYVHSYMHLTPVDDNLKEGGKAVKPLIIEDYSTHQAYIGLSDGTADSYSSSKKTWKWVEKLSHLLDIHILNSYILYKFYGGNVTYTQLSIIRDNGEDGNHD